MVASALCSSFCFYSVFLPVPPSTSPRSLSTLSFLHKSLDRWLPETKESCRSRFRRTGGLVRDGLGDPEEEPSIPDLSPSFCAQSKPCLPQLTDKSSLCSVFSRTSPWLSKLISSLPMHKNTYLGLPEMQDPLFSRTSLR